MTAPRAFWASSLVNKEGSASDPTAVGNFLSYAFPSLLRALYTSLCLSAIVFCDCDTSDLISAATTGGEGVEAAGPAREDRIDSRLKSSPSSEVSAVAELDEVEDTFALAAVVAGRLDGDGDEDEEADTCEADAGLAYNEGTLAATRSTSFSIASILALCSGRHRGQTTMKKCEGCQVMEW